MVATKVRLVELPGSLRFSVRLTRTTFWQSTMARNKANTWSPVVVALSETIYWLFITDLFSEKRSMSSATGN